MPLDKLDLWSPISKVEETGDGDGSVYVYGKVSDGSVDSQGQITDPTWFKGESQRWKAEWGNIREMHQLSAVGVAKDLTFDHDDAFLGAKIVDPVAVTKVREGVYKGFSYRAINPVIKSDRNAPRGRISGGEIIEVSLADRPALSTAKLLVAKVDGYDEEEDPEGMQKAADGEAGDITLAEQAIALVRQLIAREASEIEDSVDVWDLQMLVDVLSRLQSFSSNEQWEAMSQIMDAGQPATEKVGKEISAANRLNLQGMHDAITKMAPEVCGGSGDNNVAKVAAEDIEGLDERIAALIAEHPDIAKVLGEGSEESVSKVEFDALKAEFEELASRPAPTAAYFGGAQHVQEVQKAATADPERARMERMSQSNNPLLAEPAQKWLANHPKE